VVVLLLTLVVRLVGIAVFLVGLALLAYGVILWTNQRQIGARWSASVVEWHERWVATAIRRFTLRSARGRDLYRFGALVVMLVGLGWTATGLLMIVTPSR
jgi:hypothetical protein